jgi:penicillin-binding protein 1A
MWPGQALRWPLAGLYLTIAVDRLTNCLASPQTPTERVAWLQVPEGRLSEFQCNR